MEYKPHLKSLNCLALNSPLSSNPLTRRDKHSENVKRWGKQVVYIFDRGFAGGPWLAYLLSRMGKVRFVLRRPKGYKLVGLVAEGGIPTIPKVQALMTKPAWQHLRRKRSWTGGQIWDIRR